MLDSQDERSGLHAVRQNHLVFLPSGRAGVSTRQKIGMKEGREVLGWFEVHPRLGISLREKMGAYSRRCPPPADRARRWTIHQQPNQTDLEHTGTRASDAGEERYATASAATDWPDLSYSSSALIRTRSIKEILTRVISLPPCRELRHPELQIPLYCTAQGFKSAGLRC